MVDRDGGSTADGRGADDIPGAATANRVSLVQRLGDDGPLRTLTVEPDGRWECDDCAGDGVTSTGYPGRRSRCSGCRSCSPTPRLAQETDQVRKYRATCIDALTSSLLTRPA